MYAAQKDIKSWLWVVALVIVLAVAPEPVVAESVSPGELQSGSLLLRMQNGYTSATLLNTDVDMDISGLVARVKVRQEFQNTSLVEQQRANLFTTSVANVAPGELVVIEIEYLEDIRYEKGQFSIRFPMTLTPRYISGSALPDRIGSGWAPDTDRVPDASSITPPQVMNSKAHQLSLTASVNAGTPLEIIASRYHPVRISEKKNQYTVALRSGTVAMDHDFELVYRWSKRNGPYSLR